MLAIARNYSVPWDALAFTMRDLPIQYGFALFAWGLIADIDIGTGPSIICLMIDRFFECLASRQSGCASLDLCGSLSGP